METRQRVLQYKNLNSNDLNKVNIYDDLQNLI